MKLQLSDIETNNYNEDVLKVWQANMDIQLVTDVFACVTYIVSYTCKAQQSMGELLKGVVKETANKAGLNEQMTKVAATFLNHQEVSAQEAAYRLLSLYLKNFQERSSTSIQTLLRTESSCVKPMTDIANKKDDDQDLFLPSVHETVPTSTSSWHSATH